MKIIAFSWPRKLRASYISEGPLYGSNDVGVELLYQSSSNETEIDETLKKPVETTTSDVKSPR